MKSWGETVCPIHFVVPCVCFVNEFMGHCVFSTKLDMVAVPKKTKNHGFCDVFQRVQFFGRSKQMFLCSEESRKKHNQKST